MIYDHTCENDLELTDCFRDLNTCWPVSQLAVILVMNWKGPQSFFWQFFKRVLFSSKKTLKTAFKKKKLTFFATMVTGHLLSENLLLPLVLCYLNSYFRMSQCAETDLLEACHERNYIRQSFLDETFRF